jgi:prepilin-type N-terminal cleavage/methylation domain-containing protein
VKKKGITLIELLIVMVLMGIVMPVISSIFITGLKTFNQEFTQTELQSNAQTILDEILNDAKNAQAVEETYGTYTTGANTIILRVPTINSAQVIQYEDSSMLFDRIVYYYEVNKIHKVVFADSRSIRFGQNNTNKVLASNILALNFTYDPDVIAPTLVSTTVSNVQEVGKLTRSVSVTGKARLRNHI